MIINYVQLQNIRSYASQVVRLNKHRTLLSGDIGSGKTTILMAIEFALFGLLRGHFSGNSLLRNNTAEGFVELGFELENKEVVIRRTLKRSKNNIVQGNGFIKINNQIENLTPVELKAKIINILTYPKDLISKNKNLIFRFTVYTPQEEMKAIVYEDKDIRVNTLRKLFGIDKYKRIEENIGIYIKELREKERELKGKAFDLDEKREILQGYDKKINKIDMEIKGLAGPINELSKKKDEISSKIIRLNEKEKQFNELSNQLKIINEKINDNVKSFKSIEARAKEIQIEKLDISLEALESRKSILREKISNINKEIEATRKEKQEKEEELKEKQNLLASCKTSLENFAENLKGNERELAILEKKLQGQEFIELNLDALKSEREELRKEILKSQDSKLKIEQSRARILERQKESARIINEIKGLDYCPLCHQDVSDEHKQKIMNEERSKIEENKKELEKNNAGLKEIQIKLRDFEERLKKIEELISKAKIQEEQLKLRDELKERQKSLADKNKEFSQSIKECENRIKTLEKEIKKKAVAIDDLKRKEKALDLEITNNRKELNEIDVKEEKIKGMEEKRRLIERLNKEKADLKEEISSLNRKKLEIDKIIDELSFDNEALKVMERELDKLKKSERDIEIRENSLKTEMRTLMEIKAKIQKEINTKQEAIAEIREIEKIRLWIEQSFTIMIKTIEKNVMASIHKQFNELFKKWFNALIEDNNIIVRLDEDFTPIININGYEGELNQLSGGEKTSISLAYRLALNKVINDLTTDIKTKDILILDEPTDGFSNEQLDKVREVLDMLNVKQVIIVSHERKIESFVDEIIRIEKDNNISKVI